MTTALNVLRDEGLIYTIQGRGSFVADYEGSGIDYTPPAWYLANNSKATDAESSEGTAEKTGADSGAAAGSTLTAMLTALRDELRALSAEHQALRREVEELKKAQQSHS